MCATKVEGTWGLDLANGKREANVKRSVFFTYKSLVKKK